MKFAFKVILEIPSDADLSITDIKGYIKDSLNSFKGGLHPSDPKQDIIFKSVKITEE